MQMSSQLRLLSPEIVGSIKLTELCARWGVLEMFSFILYLKFLSPSLPVCTFEMDLKLKAADYRFDGAESAWQVPCNVPSFPRHAD